MERKTEFWWASIHGADPEPVEKTEHEGRPCVYTCGCADPFYLDEGAILFVRTHPLGKLDRPEHPSKHLAERAATPIWRQGHPYHSWRGPR